jgi:serine phosphatase RsbU (regulator of sigma subunit)
MIDLGEIIIRTDASLADARLKVLGVAASLGAEPVRATRLATGASEVLRLALAHADAAHLHVAVRASEAASSLVLKVHPAPPDGAGPGAPFFDHVRDAPGSLELEARVPGARAIDHRWVEVERARVARKSRDELMDELRRKNRELEEYNARLELTVAQRTVELRAANDAMRRDLDAGAQYVRALIPPPAHAPVAIDWRYVPSSNLGGDTIGYHWIDPDHLALYLIDVTGHGLDAALLAVTVTNVIRAGSLASADMRRPADVVAALNNAFQGEHHGLKYFTIWYGVYRPSTRRLAWSGGGHHPALLIAPDSTEPLQLPASGPIMGAVPDMDFPAEDTNVPRGARFLLFSDGIFEILRDDQVVWNLDSAILYLARHAHAKDLLDTLLSHVRDLRASPNFDDDFSIIDASFA